jgi:hypothetical protein
MLQEQQCIPEMQPCCSSELLTLSGGKRLWSTVAGFTLVYGIKESLPDREVKSAEYL